MFCRRVIYHITLIDGRILLHQGGLSCFMEVVVTI